MQVRKQQLELDMEQETGSKDVANSNKTFLLFCVCPLPIPNSHLDSWRWQKKKLRRNYSYSQLTTVVPLFNKEEVDGFLELSCFFHDPMDVSSLISSYSAFSKSSLNIWKFTVHILLKHGLENFEHYFASMWDDCNCAVVWAFFGIAFPWDWNENWLFPVLRPLLIYLSEKKCLTIPWKRELDIDIFIFPLAKYYEQ